MNLLDIAIVMKNPFITAKNTVSNPVTCFLTGISEDPVFLGGIDL